MSARFPAYLQHDLADMRAVFHAPVRHSGIRQRKDAVHHRAEFAIQE